MEVLEKVKNIRELAKKHGITAYDIGNNTPISLTSARNVLEEDNIKYRIKTLNIILDYIEKSIVGTTGNTEVKKEHTQMVAEPSATYGEFNSLSFEDKLAAIYSQNNEILKETTNINRKISILANVINIDTEASTITDLLKKQPTKD